MENVVTVVLYFFMAKDFSKLSKSFYNFGFDFS